MGLLELLATVAAGVASTVIGGLLLEWLKANRDNGKGRHLRK